MPPRATTNVADAVLATVAYSDVFDMPIEMDRLHRFLIGRAAGRDEVEAAVRELTDDGRLLTVGPLVHLPGRECVVEVHRARVARAETMWADASRWGGRIGALPFVRAVAVTGGLACDSVADHDDIDYLIVTHPGRLWMARLGVVIVVHIGRRFGVDICPNYLVASDALKLDERTSYTARELAQMVDIAGPDVLTEMRTQNDWFRKHLPNTEFGSDPVRQVRPRFTRLQRMAESVLGLAIFDRLERWEMRRKIERLRAVASRRSDVANPDESSFSPSVCKGHMVGNAAGIEAAWRDRLGRYGGHAT